MKQTRGAPMNGQGSTFNTLKILAFSATATAMGVTSAAAPSVADEPGKNGFFMNFSTIGASIGDPSSGGSTLDGFGFIQERPGVFRMADYAADFSGVVRFGYGHGNFSTDLEFGVRRLDGENLNRAAGGDGNIDVYMAMINAAMDFDPYGGVTPFFAFGVGGALGDGDTEGSGFTAIAPTGHLDFGARVALTPTADLSIGYSFLVAPPSKYGNGDSTPAHSLTLSFDFKF